MPTKRRFILFLIVLALMLLIKRAVGQEPTVGWDPVSVWDGPNSADVEADLYGPMLAGVVCGIISGLVRVAKQRQDWSEEVLGDLIQLRLQ